MDASVTGTSVEKESVKVGDIEKEKEIERRLRELGLWENKRLLESRVASMLEDHIDEKDVLSRTLRNCRRRRGGESGGKTAVEEIRKIISPRIIRDCYGQKLAYHVNILMGCFTKNIEHEVIDDVVVIRGSTAAEYDPKRLTKELRLELPPSLNMAALQVSYAAGAVKIRVPYLLDLPLPQERSSESSDDRAYQFASISPIYSMNVQLSSANRTKLGSSGAESPSSDSPNSATSLLSPPVPQMSDSPEESIDLQPRSPILESPSPSTSIPSSYPVFEDESWRAAGYTSEEGNDMERCTTEPAIEDIAGEAPRIIEGIRYNGLPIVSGRGNSVTPFVVESDNETALSEEFCHKSASQDEFLPGAETFTRSNGCRLDATDDGHCISEEHGRMITEENHNRIEILKDSNEDNATSNRTLLVSNETVDSKRIDDRLGNDYLRNRISANMAAIYVNIADSSDRNTDEDFDDAAVISKGLKHPMEVTSHNERNTKHTPSSDHSKMASLGYIGDNRQDEGMILTHDVFSESGCTSAQSGQTWKSIAGNSEIRNTEIGDNQDIPVAKSNIYDKRSAMSVQRAFNPSEELEQTFINGRTENTSNFESDAKVTEHNGHSATDLYNKSRSQENDVSKSTSDKTAFENDYEDEEHFSVRLSSSETAIMPEGIPIPEKSLSKKTHISALPRDDRGVSVQEKSCDEKFLEKNCLREEATEICEKFDMFGGKDEQVSHVTTNYHDCGKVLLEDTSDELWMNWSKGNNTNSFKQNRQREEQDEEEAGFYSVTEDFDTVATSNRLMMSPRPKKPNKNLNSLLDCLEETLL